MSLLAECTYSLARSILPGAAAYSRERRRRSRNALVKRVLCELLSRRASAQVVFFPHVPASDVYDLTKEDEGNEECSSLADHAVYILQSCQEKGLQTKNENVQRVFICAHCTAFETSLVLAGFCWTKTSVWVLQLDDNEHEQQDDNDENDERCLCCTKCTHALRAQMLSIRALSTLDSVTAVFCNTASLSKVTKIAVKCGLHVVECMPLHKMGESMDDSTGTAASLRTTWGVDGISVALLQRDKIYTKSLFTKQVENKDECDQICSENSPFDTHVNEVKGLTQPEKMVRFELDAHGAPLLQSDEVLALIGSHNSVGKWNSLHAQVLNRNESGGLYTASVALSQNENADERDDDVVVEYKYAVLDCLRNVRYWECGQNRRLHVVTDKHETTADNDDYVMVVRDTWRNFE